jgi:hypothetical protein
MIMGRVRARIVPSSRQNFISKPRLYPFFNAFKSEPIKAGKGVSLREER